MFITLIVLAVGVFCVYKVQQYQEKYPEAARQRAQSIASIFGLLIGAVLGALIGFLLRPSAMLVGQLPLDAVITRGATLKGLDEILIPVAQASFNYVLGGAIIGTIASRLIARFASKK